MRNDELNSSFGKNYITTKRIYSLRETKPKGKLSFLDRYCRFFISSFSSSSVFNIRNFLDQNQEKNDDNIRIGETKDKATLFVDQFCLIFFNVSFWVNFPSEWISNLIFVFDSDSDDNNRLIGNLIRVSWQKFHYISRSILCWFPICVFSSPYWWELFSWWCFRLDEMLITDSLII